MPSSSHLDRTSCRTAALRGIFAVCLVGLIATRAAAAGEAVAPPSPATPATIASVFVAAVIALSGWIGAFTLGPRIVAAIGVAGLTRIGLLSALHFTVSFTSRVAGYVISALVGPFYIFATGIGDELLPCLVQAATVAIVPRVGTHALSSIAVFLLNGVVAGQLGAVDVWFVSLSATLGELCLLAAGVTQLPGSQRRLAANAEAPGRVVAQRSWTMRCALALGAFNGGALYLQYDLYRVLYSVYFGQLYVLSVALIVGFLYGAVGALWGARIGMRLRGIC